MKSLSYLIISVFLFTIHIYGQGFTFEQRSPGDYFSSCEVNDTTVVSFGKNIMAVYNFSNPDAPKIMSLTETDMSVCWTIGSINNYLFLINQARIKVYDINDPFNPSFLYKNDTIPISNATIKDTLLIVQQSSNKIIIYDFSDINNPVIHSQITSPGTVSDFEVENSSLYISRAGTNNFAVYDISNPGTPLHIAAFGSLPYVTHITVKDSILIALKNHYVGYQIYNVKNAENPVLLGEIWNPDYYESLTYYEMAVVGSHLVMRNKGGMYVNSLHGNIYLADISNLQSPGYPHSQHHFGSNNICIFNGRFIASNNLGLSVHEITADGYLSETGNAYNPSPMANPQLFGDKIYFNHNGLGLIDLSNESIGLNYHNSFNKVFKRNSPIIFEDTLFVAIQQTGYSHDSLLVFKGDDYSSLSLIGKCDVSRHITPYNLTLYNGIMYGYSPSQYDYTNIRMYDLRDLTNPESSGVFLDTMITRDFIRFFNLLYFVGNELNIYDISWPLAPSKVYEEYTEDILPRMDDPVLHAGYLYCSYQDGFAAWDISNPIEPELALKKKIAPNFYPRFMLIHNNKLIIINYEEIRTYDVSDPTAPQFIDSSPNGYDFNDAFYYNGRLILTSQYYGIYVFKDNGVVSVDESKENKNDFPTTYVLSQNYPNPFNPATTISFSLREYSDVRLSVFNVLGEEVTELLNGTMEAGSHEIRFDASALPSGIYFYRLQAGTFSETRKMLLLR